MAHNFKPSEIYTNLLGINGTGVAEVSDYDPLVGKKNFTRYDSKFGNLPIFDEASEEFGAVGGGSLRRRHGILNKIKQGVEDSEEMRELFSELEGKPGSRATRAVDRFNRNFSRSAQNFYKQAQEVIEKNEEAKLTALEGIQKLKDDAFNAYTKAKADIAALDFSGGKSDLTVKIGGKDVVLKDKAAKDEALKNLNENWNELKGYLNGKLKNSIVDPHEDTVTELKNLMVEVEEKTGIKIPPKGAASVAQAVESRVESRVEQGIEKGAEKAATSLGTKLVGAGLLGGGGALVFNGMQDENGPMNIKTFLGGAGLLGGFLTLAGKFGRGAIAAAERVNPAQFVR